MGSARAEFNGGYAAADEIRAVLTDTRKRVVLTAVDGEREASSPDPDAVQLPTSQNFGRESRQPARGYLPNVREFEIV